jgi:branched-chain amino acid transport system permease protein
MKAIAETPPIVIIGRRSRWRAEEALFLVASIAAFFLFPTSLVLITQILISGLFALSLDLLLGYGGIASLGHAAFFGLGAYTAGLLANHGWGEPVSGLICAAAVAGMFGLLCSLIVVKVNGIALLMVTMCIGLLVYEGASRVPWITGGDSGLQGIEMWPLLGLFDFDLYGRTAFWYTFVVGALVYLGARRFLGSPEGLALEGIRENARRIPALGISVERRKMLAFLMAAAIAGVAGGLLAQTTQVVALETLSFDRSISTLIMLVVGGIGTLIGGFVGAAVFVYARDVLSSLSPVYWMFWLGLLLMALVLVGRGGVVGILRRAAGRIRSHRGSAR